MRRILLLFAVFLAIVFYGIQLDTLRFLEVLGAFILVSAGSAFWDFKEEDAGLLRRISGAILPTLACFVSIAVAWGLWRNPDRMLAASSAAGYPRLIAWSLQRGAHINGSAELNIPIIYALNGRQLTSIQALVQSGADVNVRDRGGRTTLMNAAGRGYTEIVEYLCKAGADPNLKSNDGGTALNEAADFGQAEAVRTLINHGALIDQPGEAGRTPLIDGAAHPDVVRVLLAAHAGVNFQANDGVTALMVASGRDVPESVELLLKAGADPAIKDREGRTALDVAKQYGAGKTIPLLVH